MTAAEEPSAPSPRIGNAEREAAQKALDEHLQAGRLDAEEYGERSAQASVARTADDLTPLFADLPEPHATPQPAAGRPHPPSGPPAAASAPAVAGTGGSAVDRVGPGILAALPLIAVVLFFVVPIPNAWVFFLLIPIGGIVFARTRAGRRGGDDG